MAGININLISIERLSSLSSKDKIKYILNEVKRGNVLVLEQGLTAEEEAELIKTTMSNIDLDAFIGIEMQSYSQEDINKGSWLSKLLRRKHPPRMSVIGPADLLKTIHKDGNMIQAVVLTRDAKMDTGGKAERPPPPRSMTQAASGSQGENDQAVSSEEKKEENGPAQGGT